MPFTPFHFGPSACISLPLKRHIDVPLFILANVAIDIEPLLVMIFNLSYPLHGLAHSYVGATIIGLSFGGLSYFFRDFIKTLMVKMFRLQYSASLKKYLLSGILGCYFHILLDSTLYTDMKPFYPFSDSNPLLGLIQSNTMYNVCAYSFIPAIAIYLLIVIKTKNAL